MNKLLSSFSNKIENISLNHKNHQRALVLLKDSLVWAKQNKQLIDLPFLQNFKTLAFKCSDKIWNKYTPLDNKGASEALDFLTPLLLKMQSLVPEKIKSAFLSDIFLDIEIRTQSIEKSATTKLITRFMMEYKKINGEELNCFVMNKIIKSLYSSSCPIISFRSNNKKGQKVYFKTLCHNNDFLLSKKIISAPFEHLSTKDLINIYRSTYRGFHTILNPIMAELDELTYGPNPHEEVINFLHKLPIATLKNMLGEIVKSEGLEINPSQSHYSPFLNLIQTAFNKKMVESEKNNLANSIALAVVAPCSNNFKL